MHVQRCLCRLAKWHILLMLSWAVFHGSFHDIWKIIVTYRDATFPLLEGIQLSVVDVSSAIECGAMEWLQARSDC